MTPEDRKAILAACPAVPESAPSTTLDGSFATRVGKTLTFRLAGPATDQTQEAHILSKLGPVDGKVLIEDLRETGANVSGKTPALNEVILRTDSNYKDRTTQADRTRQAALYPRGLADPVQATNIAIEAVCRAKTAGIELRTINSESYETKGARIEKAALEKGLGKETATMLKMLTSGVIRVEGSRSGALDVDDGGRLRAGGFGDRRVSDAWAFGGGSPAESKIL